EIDALVECLWETCHLVDEIGRFGFLVTELSENIPVPRIASASRDYVDRAAVRKSELGGKRVAIDLIFLDGVQRKCRHSVLAGAIFIFTAIDSREVVAAVASTNGKPSGQVSGKAGVLAAGSIGVGNAGQGVNILGEIPINIRKFLDLNA